MGKLKYRGNVVYYNFQDQYGHQQRLSLKLKVDRIRKDPKGKEIFPAEAYEVKKKIDREVFDGIWGLERAPEAPPITLQAAFDLFIAAYRNKNTKHVYQLSFDKLLDYFKDIPIETIDEASMLKFKEHLFERYKEVTVEIFLRHIKIFLKYVEDEGYIKRSPVTKRVRMSPVETDIVIFSDPDLDTFFTDMKAAYLGAYYQLRFLLLSGWRVSDSCALTWDKVDFDRRVIKHYIGKKKKPWEYPMDTELATFLGKLPRTHEPFVFLYRDYHFLGSLFREIADALNENKEPKIKNHADLSIHTLRKQFTFNCFRRGVPLEICSKLLGHSSIKTTEKYYTYWDTQLLRDGLATSRDVKPVKKSKKQKAG